MIRDNAGVLIVGVGCLLLLGGVSAAFPLETTQTDQPNVDVPSSPADDRDEEPDPEVDLSNTVPLPVGTLLGLGATAVVLGLFVYLLLFRSPGQPTAPPAPAAQREEPEPSLEEVAAAAGRAADRMSTTDAFEHEVYRAWWTMTRALSIPAPATKTPGEFATAAIHAGMDEADVRELTRIFNAVRYGDREPSGEERRRAIAILETIASEYEEETTT